MTKTQIGIVGGLLGVVLLGGAALKKPLSTAYALGLNGGLGGEMANRPLLKLIQANLGRFLTMKAELGVTETQRQEIKTVLEGHKGEIVDVARRVKGKADVVKSAVAVDQPDERAIRAAAADLAGVLGDAAVLHAKIRGEVRTHLDPGQREQIDRFHEEVSGSIDRFLEEAGQP